jgi:hypothetical protein
LASLGAALPCAILVLVSARTHLSGACGNNALALGSRGEDGAVIRGFGFGAPGFGLHVQASTYSVR